MSHSRLLSELRPFLFLAGCEMETIPDPGKRAALEAVWPVPCPNDRTAVRTLRARAIIVSGRRSVAARNQAGRQGLYRMADSRIVV